MADTYGPYFIYRALSSTRRGEGTNLGVLLFDDQGNQIGHRVDTLDRAVARGDLAPYWIDPVNDYWNAGYADSFLGSLKTLAQIVRLRDSTGHAMSCMQLCNGGTSLIYPELLDDLFSYYVLGISC